MRIFESVLVFVIVITNCKAEESANACDVAGSTFFELQCPSPKTIQVTSAVYGQWAVICEPGQCCETSDADCTEDMATYHPDDYQAIVRSCDGNTSCSVQYYTRTLDTCNSPFVSQYGTVYYICYPEDTTTTSTTTTTTTTTTPPPSVPPYFTTKKPGGGGDDDGGTPVAAIVGGVVAAVLLIVLIVLLVFLFIRLRRKPPPKRKVRIVKRPSGAQRPPGQHAPAKNNAQPNGKPTPIKNEPVPPFVAYDNNAYEQEVDIVIDKKPNELTGAADLSGNVPKIHARTSAVYENVGSSQNAPNRPNKPPVSRASKPKTNSGVTQNGASNQSRDSNYDTPKSQPTKPREKKYNPSASETTKSDTNSSAGSAMKEKKQISLTPGQDSATFSNSKKENDVYEEIGLKA